MKTEKNGLDEKKMKIVKIYENGWEGTKVEWGDKKNLNQCGKDVVEIGMDEKRK
jgi:hypothetical protein